MDLSKSQSSTLLISNGIRNAAARAPSRNAIEFGSDALTYRQLVERMGCLGSVALEQYGLAKGDVVAFISKNCLEYIEVVAGLSDQGIIVATLNPALSVSELATVFEDCAPKMAIIDGSREESIEQAHAMGVPVITLGKQYNSLIGLAQPLTESPSVFSDDTFSICYTSGTTGKPKGVMLSHRSRALIGMASAIEYQCFGYSDRFLAIAPMFHGAGFAFALAAVSHGGTCVILNSGNAEEIVNRLGQGDIHGVFMVPTHFKRMADLSEGIFDRFKKTNSLKTIISNAAALAPNFKRFAFDHLGEGLLNESYGSTEAGVVTNMRPSYMLDRIESVGTPFIQMEISIRNERGQECEPGEVGELFARGPYTFSGYLNRHQETAETIKDGWVTVQDLATRDKDGYISIVGRLKDVIISGGINVYPADIEKVISCQQGVSEVAVVGIPDEEWGESVHAFVVGEQQDVSKEAILEACRSALSSYKVPRGITLIDELPRNPSGKILKIQLREIAVQQA